MIVDLPVEKLSLLLLGRFYLSCLTDVVSQGPYKCYIAFVIVDCSYKSVRCLRTQRPHIDTCRFSLSWARKGRVYVKLLTQIPVRSRAQYHQQLKYSQRCIIVTLLSKNCPRLCYSQAILHTPLSDATRV